MMFHGVFEIQQIRLLRIKDQQVAWVNKRVNKLERKKKEKKLGNSFDHLVCAPRLMVIFLARSNSREPTNV